MNTFQNRMSKQITLARFRKVALGCMGVLCLSAGLLFSQEASAQATTSNLDLHFELIKATNTGTVSFTIAPEDPNQFSRAHWPIIFIDWENDGNKVTQMFNLTADRTFTVNVTAAGAGVATVYGENGTWKLICKSQNIKATKLEKATALRYLDLSKNVLGTNNTNKDYTIHDDNNKIETLNLSENGLKDIKFGTPAVLNGVLPELKEYSASENLLSTVTLTGNNKLSYLDLSKNLLTSITLPTAFVPTWTVFKGGNQTDYDAALAATIPGPITNTASTQIHTNRTTANDGMLNLTVNKLDIAKLPTLPTNLNVSKYYYTLQERYSLTKNEYKMLEEIDLSSQLTATGVKSTPQTTTYRWFREITPGTDEYTEMVRGSDYEETGGKTKFYRAYGDDTKIFAAMTTDAFGMTGTYPLESFERGTGTINLHGFENVLLQPAGTTAAALKDTYFAQVQAAALNQIGDGKEAKAKATQFFRTNTLTVKGSKNNFWYGFKSNDWNDVENWTGRVVPKTLIGDYTNDENSDVLFASIAGYTIGSETLKYPTSAIRDLYTDQDRMVRNLYNNSEDGRAIVADANHTLKLRGQAHLGAATKAPFNTATDLSYRTIVKSVENKPNGTFLIEKPTDNPNYVATVEFYSKANDGNRNKQAARWQYFGSPVQDAKVYDVVPATSWVRKYKRELNLADTDEKWEEVPAGANFTPGHGYEITQPRPMTYRFTGKLDLADHNFPVDGVAGGPGVNYKDMNILANPYTAAMKIADIDWTGAAGVAEQTVYLYNTGSREEWLAQNGGTTNGTNAGQYVKAVPKNLSGYVVGMPEEIPSLSAFMIKSTGAGTVKYRYQDLLKNTAQNRAPRRRFSSLMIDVESDKSADRMWLVEAQGKTKGYDDGFDGEKIFTAASAQLYAIQDRNYQVTTAEDLDNTELGFVAGDGAKHYTLKFNLDEMSDDRYYLVDHLTHEQKPITNGMTYSFNAGANDPANRFAISRSTKSITDDVFEGKGIELRAKSGRTIEARNYTDETAEVEIFDVSGKVVDKFTVEPHDTDRIKLSLEGVFVVRAYNGQAKTTQKFIIK